MKMRYEIPVKQVKNNEKLYTDALPCAELGDILLHRLVETNGIEFMSVPQRVALIRALSEAEDYYAD